MDVLSDVLDTMRLESTVFAYGELDAPWGMRVAASEHFPFYIVTRGRCWIDVDGELPMPIGPGDVVVVVRGRGHALRDARDSALVWFDELLASGSLRALRRGPAPAGDGTVQLACGCFRLAGTAEDLLVTALPPLLHAREIDNDVGAWLAQVVKLLQYEALSERPGAGVIINRLCDALFVYALRSYLIELPAVEASWLRALVEPHIGPALKLIHESPRNPWTVAMLAARVGMSRSAFAAHFTRVVGETPMQYLIRWRLRKAASMLLDGDAPVADIAGHVGYDSEAAFSKAFRRSMGVSPGAYRRGVHSEPPPSTPSSYSLLVRR